MRCGGGGGVRCEVWGRGRGDCLTFPSRRWQLLPALLSWPLSPAERAPVCVCV